MGILFHRLDRRLDYLCEYEGHDEAVDRLEYFVREHSLEQLIIIEAKHLFVNHKVNHVHKEVLA